MCVCVRRGAGEGGGGGGGGEGYVANCKEACETSKAGEGCLAK